MTAATETLKHPIHLRVREDNEIGFSVRYVGLCGFESTRRGDVSKNAKVVTCATCAAWLRKNAKERITKCT